MCREFVAQITHAGWQQHDRIDYHPLPQSSAERTFGVFLELLPQLMILAQPDVTSTHPEA